ncbi:MAG: heme-binding domain-containing protein [Chlorobium sp.]
MTFSFKSTASWSLVVLILMQFVPLKRINPPVVSEIQLPHVIKSSLKKACYDCHSNETRWDSFGYVAPASWLASTRVASGRTALNFSTGNSQKTAEKTLPTKEIMRVVTNGSAHQPLYYLWKPETHLTIKETEALLQWLNQCNAKTRVPS